MDEHWQRRADAQARGPVEEANMVALLVLIAARLAIVVVCGSLL